MHMSLKKKKKAKKLCRNDSIAATCLLSMVSIGPLPVHEHALLFPKLTELLVPSAPGVNNSKKRRLDRFLCLAHPSPSPRK